jgi:hypothetical protein
VTSGAGCVADPWQLAQLVDRLDPLGGEGKIADRLGGH